MTSLGAPIFNRLRGARNLQRSKIVTTRRKVAFVALGVLVAMAVVFLSLVPNLDPPPMRVGSSADEAWTYIHTNAQVVAGTRISSAVSTRSAWRADAHTIEQELGFYWQTNRLFATRKMIYTVGNNSTISGVNSQWKLTWPF